MLIRLYPERQEDAELHNLYLDRSILPVEHGQPFVYTNYVASLDGRIALEHPDTGHSKVPETIANDIDWHLYQELAAQADILITSGRYMRDLSKGRAQAELPVGSASQFDELRHWRTENDLPEQPAVAIVTGSMDLPWEHIREALKRPVYVVTSEQHSDSACGPAIEAGIDVIRTGANHYVRGTDLVSSLYERGFQRMYAIAGPMVLQTLITDCVLNRLFLTQVHRLLGGTKYDTILQSELLLPPAQLELNKLHLHTNSTLQQCFAIYDVKNNDE